MLVDAGAGLRALLLSSPSIVAFVDQRVFASKLAQGEIRDSLVYHPVSETEIGHYRGPSWLMSTRFQIDAYSRSRDSAEALANLVHEFISGFQGTAGGCEIQGIFHSNAAGAGYDDVLQLYNRSRDFFLWHNEVT
jgi:hypothetical protein